VVVCGRIIHFTRQNRNRKKKEGERGEGKQKQRERYDVYLGASSGGVWKDEESILPRLLLPDRHRDL
jgi:hypothetical protein